MSVKRLIDVDLYPFELNRFVVDAPHFQFLCDFLARLQAGFQALVCHFKDQLLGVFLPG